MDEDLRVVLEDLDFLSSEWDQDVSDASLRRSSPVLRRFLQADDLLKAWQKTGHSAQPQVVTSDLSKRLTITPLATVKFAVAGGAEYKGMRVAHVFESSQALSPTQQQQIFALGPPEIKQNLTDFTNSPCVIVDGITISRVQLVKYVANKLGGAHFDETRDKMYQELLDRVGKTYTIAGKKGVYFELLSIGQALVKSPDIVNLHDQLRKQLSA
jgi:hypothetical protein